MRYGLLCHGKESRLSSGQLLIGRSPDCAIVLDDPLVSRHHAAVVVDGKNITLKDLGSRNGVFLNHRRVTQHSLKLGDRILIGGHEIRVVANHSDDQSTTVRAGAPTRPADMFRVLGPLADKALALGHAREAERLLATHLRNVLTAARNGESVDRTNSERAAVFAARLAQQGLAEWLSYPFELCFALGRTCSSDVLDVLYQVGSHPTGTELGALRNYIQSQRGRLEELSPSERFLLRRVEGLERRFSA